MNSISLQSGNPIPLRPAACVIHAVEGTVQAGFPSPAEDYAVSSLNLSDLLIEHPQATFFMKVSGPSMRDKGFDDGDYVVVDKAIRPRHGHIVVAIVDGDYTLKELFKQGSVVKLCAGNESYPDIVLKDEQTLEIWGVVKGCIKLYA